MGKTLNVLKDVLAWSAILAMVILNFVSFIFLILLSVFIIFISIDAIFGGNPRFSQYNPSVACNSINYQTMDSGADNVTFYVGMNLPRALYDTPFDQWRKVPLEQTVTIFDDSLNGNPPLIVHKEMTTAEEMKKLTFQYNKILSHEDRKANLMAEVSLTRKGVDMFRTSFPLECSNREYRKAQYARFRSDRLFIFYSVAICLFLAGLTTFLLTVFYKLHEHRKAAPDATYQKLLVSVFELKK